MEKNYKLFTDENLRDKLASNGLFNKFLLTYKNDKNNLKDLNTAPFWDKKTNSNPSFDINQNPMFLNKIGVVIKHFSRLKGRLLDIGIGGGEIEQGLQRKKSSLSLYGIDISPWAVKNAKTKTKGFFKVASVYKLPFKDLYFDHVIVLDVLEHLPASKIFSAYNEISRVLRKRGTFIVSVPLNERLEEMLNNGKNPNGHMRVYTPNIIKTELKLAGFKVTGEKYLYAFNKNYARKSLIMKLFPFFPRKPNLVIIYSIKQ